MKTITSLRNTVVAVFVILLGVAVLGKYSDDGRGKPDNENKINVVLKIFVDVPSTYPTPFARGDVRGYAGKETIDWVDIKMPSTPAMTRAMFVVEHGAPLDAAVVVRSGAVAGVHCRWYLDDARHAYEGTGIGTEKVDNMNGVSAVCKGKAP
jgi:hypothetical protein